MPMWPMSSTPLTTLISSCELALRKPRDAEELRDILASNLEDLQRMAGIVADMLFLSHADRGESARRTLVPSMAGLASEVIDYHEASLQEAGLQIKVEGDASAEVDARLLRRALSNLLGNATRYAHAGSTIALRIINTAPDETLRLEVSNIGPEIAPNICHACLTASTAPMLRAATATATTDWAWPSWRPLPHAWRPGLCRLLPKHYHRGHGAARQHQHSHALRGGPAPAFVHAVPTWTVKHR